MTYNLGRMEYIILHLEIYEQKSRGKEAKIDLHSGLRLALRIQCSRQVVQPGKTAAQSGLGATSSAAEIIIVRSTVGIRERCGYE